VNISLRVLTRPRSERLPEIYRTLGTDWSERVLPSIVQARRQAGRGQHSAEPPEKAAASGPAARLSPHRRH